MRPDWLFLGKIGHERLGAHANAFRYDGLFVCFPLAQRQRLASRLFSLDGWNLFAWHGSDHGDGGDPERWMRNILDQHGLGHLDGEIWLQTLPRILGFVFNPVSFWYCHDRDGALRVVLCEVRNTFGERHCYLLSSADGGAITASSELLSRKVFHVSPFYPVDGEYHFRFRHETGFRLVQIDYHRDGQAVFKAFVSGRAHAMTDRKLLTTFLRLGWATAMVVLRINWQALRLWLKGATFHRKPAAPALEIT